MGKNANDFSKYSRKLVKGGWVKMIKFIAKALLRIADDFQKNSQVFGTELNWFPKDLSGNYLLKGIGEGLNKGLNRSLKDFSRIWCGLGKKVQIDF